jgi:hypothetical protein
VCYYVTLWRVRVTLVAVETQSAVSVCCWAACHCQLYTNIECCTTMPVWEICVAGNNRTYVDLDVKCPMLPWNKGKFVCPCPSLDMHLAKQMVMAKRFGDQTEWISHEAISPECCDCLCSCLSHLFWSTRFVIWPVWMCPIFLLYLTNGKILGKNVIEHKMCVLISSTSFVWNISLYRIIQRDITINVVHWVFM